MSNQNFIKMDEIRLLPEFTRNMRNGRAKLAQLFKAYDVAVIGYQVQEQEVSDAYNRVLSEHEFFAGKEVERHPLRVGDRVTDERDMFLLSDQDFDRLVALSGPVLVEMGVTDAEGYYLTDWWRIKNDAWRELRDFIIDHIVPAELRPVLDRNRGLYSKMDKLIQLVRKIA